MNRHFVGPLSHFNEIEINIFILLFFIYRAIIAKLYGYYSTINSCNFSRSKYFVLSTFSTKINIHQQWITLRHDPNFSFFFFHIFLQAMKNIFKFESASEQQKFVFWQCKKKRPKKFKWSRSYSSRKIRPADSLLRDKRKVSNNASQFAWMARIRDPDTGKGESVEIFV